MFGKWCDKNSIKEVDSVEKIKELNATYPNVPLLFNLIGACYKELGQLEGASKMFESAVNIKPDYAEAHFNLGVVLKASGKIKEAIECYKKAIYLGYIVRKLLMVFLNPSRV